MKVGVIKLGSRISFNAKDTSGGNGEARSIIKMLHMGGAEVHIFTKILKKDTLVADYVWHDIEESQDTAGLDALIIINGSVNFFGGSEDRAQIYNYLIINQFQGKVFYIYCDPELTLKQIWPSIASKPWAGNWNQTELEITRKDIVYLSQPYDVTAVLSSFNQKEVFPSSVKHFPFEKFPCLNQTLPINVNAQIDLSYGGTMRGGKRIKKMLKFYFGHPSDISVEMFGKIKIDDFTSDQYSGMSTPIFTGPIRYDEMLPKMNKAMAHCVIGDPYYEEINDMAQRAYESIWSSVVTFIDADLDKRRRVYGVDRLLADFLYVQDRAELSEKIKLLKSDSGTLRKNIIECQFAVVDFHPQAYCDSFIEMLT